MKAIITSKGQITLPVEARRRLDLKTGTKLEVIVTETDRLELIPLAESITSLKGMVRKPKKALTQDDMDNAIASGAIS